MNDKQIQEHSVYKYANAIEEISKDLFANTLINYICLARAYNNGDYGGLLSDIRWGYTYLKNDYQDLGLEHQIISQISGAFFCNLATFKTPCKKIQGYYDNLAHLKHGSCVFLVDDHVEYKEVCIMTTAHPADQNDPYLIENISLLKNLFLHFKEKIYQDKNLYKAFSMRYKRKIIHETALESDNSATIKFPVKKYYLGGQFGNVAFSKREAECLKHLYQGKTAKQIAKILQLSPRTIETHLTHIKLKSQSSTLHEVCTKLESCTLLEGIG